MTSPRAGRCASAARATVGSSRRPARASRRAGVRRARPRCGVARGRSGRGASAGAQGPTRGRGRRFFNTSCTVSSWQDGKEDCGCTRAPRPPPRAPPAPRPPAVQRAGAWGFDAQCRMEEARALSGAARAARAARQALGVDHARRVYLVVRERRGPLPLPCTGGGVRMAFGRSPPARPESGPGAAPLRAAGPGCCACAWQRVPD
jgi:hypothetical protein